MDSGFFFPEGCHIWFRFLSVMTSLHYSRRNTISFVLQKSGYLGLYCKMMAQSRKTLSFASFPSSGYLFYSATLLMSWHSLFIYFSMKKITFSLHSLSSYSQWIQQVVCQFLRNYTGKRWTGVDGLTFLNSCCVVDSAVLEKNRSWRNAAMSSPLLPKALANIYIWRKCGSQRDSWQRD